MGTSNSYGGPKGALEPDWLDDDENAAASNGGGEDGAKPDDTDGTEGANDGKYVPPAAVPPVLPPLGGPRGSFTRFTNSGATGALSKAISGYTASAGGARGAVRRMPNSVRTASGVASFASAFTREGPSEALRRFDLQDLAGRPALEVFEALVDELCPEGGTLDEAVARDAFIEAIATFAEQDLGNFDQLTVDQLDEFLAEVITGCIIGKVINDIGGNSLHGSVDDNRYRDAEATLREYASGAVRDELTRSFEANRSMTSTQMHALIAEIFEDSLAVLQATLEADA